MTPVPVSLQLPCSPARDFQQQSDSKIGGVESSRPPVQSASPAALQTLMRHPPVPREAYAVRPHRDQQDTPKTLAEPLHFCRNQQWLLNSFLSIMSTLASPACYHRHSD
ncbi:hypothetical protein ElyMa_001854800 [Elysia marginata]|uniref:Uncharacterized protein n=1 Tax=Elysia marginata TaxID=1093978 RepID=A0AAV4EKU6_9GAST|nr:hypothetical protein ElyMa_001854800 [Elysia marginata]